MHVAVRTCSTKGDVHADTSTMPYYANMRCPCAEALWTGHPGEASGGSRGCSESPFSVLQTSSGGSSPQAGPPVARSNSGAAKPSQQQPHQQLQMQQRRRSQQMLEQSSAGGICPSPSCPAVVVPSSAAGISAAASCLQPWEQQAESWHERQYEQQWQQGGAGSANGGMVCTTPCSLSTTMTSCMDADETSVMCAQAQQQQAVVSISRLLADTHSELLDCLC
jgi:hypothetical protein